MQRIGKKRDVFLLVDGDKAGESIKKIEQEDIKVISLKDINPEWKDVEILFSESDRTRFGIQRKNSKYVKSSALSSNIKKYSDANDFSDESKENFRRVFDKLIEENS